MKNIFFIELKRLIKSKMTIAIMATVSIYSYYIMHSEIILGVEGTAPYSPLSFGTYIKAIAPLLIIGLLLLITTLHTKKARNVKVLFNATQVDQKQYLIIRYLVIGLVFAVICFEPLAYAGFVYYKLFGVIL